MTGTLDALDDAGLAARALAGRQDGYAELFQRHRDPIYRLVRGHVGDADEALDLVQEAFAAAFQALARYDSRRPFRSWLARIAINECRDWARRRAVRRVFAFALPIEAAAAVADPSHDPDSALAERVEVDRTMRAIAALPASLKEPLLLHAIEGLSQGETAIALGVSAKAVELRIRRARTALAQALAAG